MHSRTPMSCEQFSTIRVAKSWILLYDKIKEVNIDW